jgi:pantetheine-phosphate adenylyltransferase
MTQRLNPKHAVYVGSFDPVTLGHVDIIVRGACIFDALTIGIGINPEKTPLFTPEERLGLMRDVFSAHKNIQVKTFSGLTVKFVRECGAKVMLRGLRTLTDLESEFTMSLANHVLDPDLETMFLMASDKYTHISSTLIKQIAQMGGEEGDRLLKDFVPKPVIAPLLAKYAPG